MIIADLQIHSRYARACSRNTNFDLLEKYARIKGLNLLGTGDFQHPIWNKEIKDKLKEDENGILWSKTGFPFIWQTEISLMYKQVKSRKVHHLIFSPNTEVSDQVIHALSKKGRLDYDGRPIFGFTSIELVDMMKEIDDKIEIIPAHCMTPYFGLYGSISGFDSLQECFQDNAKHIHAVETGMSADPAMLWRFNDAKRINLVSFSDAHSYWPWRLGREATVFDFKELTYDNVIKAIRTGNGLKSTIETSPSYGKYHYDGHRSCKINFSPEQTKKANGICPKCSKPMTIGVLNRVNELAGEKEGFKPENAKNFIDLIPLTELIATNLNTKSLSSQKVWLIYNNLIEKFNNELNVLINISYNDLINVVDAKLAKLIVDIRNGKLEIIPGYDGVYGEILAGSHSAKQNTLNNF